MIKESSSGQQSLPYVRLRQMLEQDDPEFPHALLASTEQAEQFGDVLALHMLRKRAVQRDRYPLTQGTLRVAILGGCSLRPLTDLFEHFTSVLLGVRLEMWVGDYDNYIAEIRSADSDLYAFAPDLVCLLPSEQRCRYTGSLTASITEQQAEADQVVGELLQLTQTVHERSNAAVVLSNFRLPPYFDPGPARGSGFTSDYAFRKLVNLRLGLQLPSFVHVCDTEFLANRLGTQRSTDERTWFESKQPFSRELMVSVARECASLAASLRRPAKKVVVLDLDNTLWGGVIGDDGLEGIELGTTSARGEAFRDFQQALLDLSRRGVLLAVCSKNNHDTAIEPFLKHPEMVLRMTDIVNFKANWEPKADNIRQIAQELNLGADSFVFLDDNPAETDLVRQFAPEVTSLCLGDDPSTFAATLKNCRLFETRSLTREDLERTELYKVEASRQALLHSSTDMDAYLASLEMVAEVSALTALDVPRVTQLINKSNQFNLTTRRRTEIEVKALVTDAIHRSFTVRLTDRFGEHGLIAVVITRLDGREMIVDTWLMSCRVLKRGVEDLVLNHILQLAAKADCTRVVGVYRPTAKNKMVQDLYSSLGFMPQRSSDEESTYELEVKDYIPRTTKILVREEAYATG